MKSIFPNKEFTPETVDIKKALGKTYYHWQAIYNFVHQSYPSAKDEWKFAGEKFGWSFRMNDKKRVIVYMLPLTKSFQVSMVFGEKATDEILGSSIAEIIKTELRNAKVYAEGRGVRIQVKDDSLLKDIQQLITIKLAN